MLVILHPQAKDLSGHFLNTLKEQFILLASGIFLLA